VLGIKSNLFVIVVYNIAMDNTLNINLKKNTRLHVIIIIIAVSIYFLGVVAIGKLSIFHASGLPVALFTFLFIKTFWIRVFVYAILSEVVAWMIILFSGPVQDAVLFPGMMAAMFVVSMFIPIYVLEQLGLHIFLGGEIMPKKKKGLYILLIILFLLVWKLIDVLS